MNALIAYTRVSTTEQSNSGLGLAAQRSAIEAAADRMGATVSEWFSDEGLSGGAIEKRLGLLAAIEAIGKGDILIVAKRDRLARDVLLSCWIEKEVSKRGGQIASAAGEGTGGNDPTAVLMRRIVDAFAEFERLTIKARTKAALGVKRRAGQRISRYLPFGYDLGPDGATLIVNETEQAVVAQIVAMRAHRMPIAKIARTLTQQNVRTKNGAGGWSRQAVYRVLRRADLPSPTCQQAGPG